MSQDMFPEEKAWAEAWNGRQGQSIAQAIGLPIQSAWSVLVRDTDEGEERKLRLVLEMPRPKLVIDVPRTYVDDHDAAGRLEQQMRDSLAIALDHTRDLYQAAITRLLEQPKPTQPAAAGVN